MFYGVFKIYINILEGLPGWLMVKNPPANAGDAGNSGLIPGWEDPLKEEMETPSSILAWKIPWAEECGGPHSMES